MKIKFLYILLFVAITQISCEDFLDKQPSDSIPQKESLRNLQDAEGFITGIYAVWNSAALYSTYLTLLPDIQCDMVYSIVGYGNSMGTVYNWKILSTDTYTKSVYIGLYQVISNTNFLFDNAHNIALKEEETERFKKLLGEAHFSRAMAYFELAQLYCPAYDPAKAEQQLGVSIWNTFSSSNPARVSLAQTYEQILEDLNAADSVIISRKADTTGISKGAVDALYARIYLYTQNWEKAIDAASRNIENPVYRLAENTGNSFQESEFYRMWKYDTSDEIIWKLQITKENSLPGRLKDLFWTDNNGSIKVNLVPSKQIIALYEQEDIRRQVYFMDTVYNGVATPVVMKYPGNPDLQATSAPSYRNMPKVMRLAEMYLIRAEAYARSGHEPQANEDLKTLRSKRIKGYQHTYVSGRTLLEEIKKERIRELYLEGYRLYDLKRYGEGFTRKKQALSLSPADQLNINATNHQFIWPIPSHEMDANRNMVQNPGY